MVNKEIVSKTFLPLTFKFAPDLEFQNTVPPTLEIVPHKQFFYFLSYVRTRQIATNNYRNPEIINNPKIYAKVIAENLRELRGNRNKNKGYRPKRKISASEGVFQVGYLVCA
jgi:hypothetical protein